jgi:hypothetical protein
MHLIQILLPLRDNAGKAFDQNLYDAVTDTLSKRFGGVTAYNRAPAEGRWESRGSTHHDEVLVVEVMADELDRGWWGEFRKQMELAFRQQEIVVRAQAIEKL